MYTAHKKAKKAYFILHKEELEGKTEGVCKPYLALLKVSCVNFEVIKLTLHLLLGAT